LSQKQSPKTTIQKRASQTPTTKAHTQTHSSQNHIHPKHTPHRHHLQRTNIPYAIATLWDPISTVFKDSSLDFGSDLIGAAQSGSFRSLVVELQLVLLVTRLFSLLLLDQLVPFL